MGSVKNIPNIGLRNKDISWEDFQVIFSPQFKIVPEKVKIETMKSEYERLTGKKVGHSGLHKKAGKADPEEDRGSDAKDN